MLEELDARLPTLCVILLGEQCVLPQGSGSVQVSQRFGWPAVALSPLICASPAIMRSR